MLHIKKLNLPKTPLRDNVIDELISIKKDYVKSLTAVRDVPPIFVHPHIIANVTQYLSSELLNILKSFGADPIYLVNFGQINKPSYTSPIHIDISPITKNKPIPFAINWELTNESLWRWWDVANAPEIDRRPLNALANKIVDPKYPRDLFFGLRYGYSEEFNEQLNDEFGFTVLESQQVPLHTAYLVRTDVPHCISYTNPSLVRVSISLRFSLSEIPTWDHAIERFAPLIIE